MTGTGGSSAFGAAGPRPGPGERCPCGSGAAYRSCCGPLHDGSVEARTAEALMRSRFSAFSVGADEYLLRTWHPRTRPEDAGTRGGVHWQRLELLDTELGLERDDEGSVEFRAHWTAPGPPAQSGVRHERSRFARRAGRWFYLDGETTDD